MAKRLPATPDELQTLEEMRSRVRLNGRSSRALREVTYGFERDTFVDRDDVGNRNETARQVRNVLDGE
jgi:hypothetical protein